MKREKWKVGDIFSVPQLDNKYCLAQILDLKFPNVPSCAFYDIRFSETTLPTTFELPFDRIIAALSTTREQLDRGSWRILLNLPVMLDREYWPNEPLRALGWVGADTFGTGIIDKFLNAYYGLVPWDIYKDPEYFDKMLFFGRKRPKNVIFKADVK